MNCSSSFQSDLPLQQLAMSSILRQVNLHYGRILHWQADPVLCTSSHDNQHFALASRFFAPAAILISICTAAMECMNEHGKLQPCQSLLFDPDWHPSAGD